jgi:hypothetical protein
MAEKTRVTVLTPTGPKETIGEIMDIKDSHEQWSEYRLEDDTTIRLKQAVVSIVKTGEKKPDGTPIYVIQSQPMVLTIPKL